MKSFLLNYAAFAACICGAGWEVRGQTTASASATVQFSNGQTITLSDFSDSVGIAPNDSATVTIQFPTAIPDAQVSVESLDGAAVSDAAVNQQGAVSFGFCAVANAGQNRLEVHYGSQMVRVLFWVLNTQNPQNNPPVITPTNP